MTVAYVPLGEFVLWMARGWRFGWVAEPMWGSHGAYRCIMRKGGCA